MIEDIALLRENMLLKVASQAKAHIKHLQKDDEDITTENKLSILKNLLDNKPSIFLERYHQFLNTDDIQIFKSYKNISTVEYFIKQIELNHKRNLSPRLLKSASRNRKYKKLQQLISEGEYFSENEMKKRDPYLYEEMVGQYLDEEETGKQAVLAATNLSSTLLNHLQAMQNNELYEKQLQHETEISEENDSEDSNEFETDQNISEISENKELLRKEFTMLMHQKFLDGLDDFDYDELQNDPELECSEILSRDKEEAYFDDSEDDS